MRPVGILLHLLVHPVRDVRRQDVQQRRRCQPLHGVVLDRTSGQIGIGDEGKVVDGPDEGAEVVLVVRRQHHLLQVVQLCGVNSPVRRFILSVAAFALAPKAELLGQ